VGIAQGHLDILMTQKLTYGVEIYPRHHKFAGEGMAQIMKTKTLDRCLLKQVLLDYKSKN
jgi:hypothetical protein